MNKFQLIYNEINKLNKCNIYPKYKDLTQNQHLRQMDIKEGCIRIDLNGMINNENKTYSRASGSFKAGDPKLVVKKCDCYGNYAPDIKFDKAHFRV